MDPMTIAMFAQLAMQALGGKSETNVQQPAPIAGGGPAASVFGNLPLPEKKATPGAVQAPALPDIGGIIANAAPAEDKKKTKGQEVLAAVPQALATIAPLLFPDQQTSTHVVGAQGGGRGGELVQGLNLPRRMTISELLAALPRPRYG
jgi:hypothetical protein